MWVESLCRGTRRGRAARGKKVYVRDQLVVMTSGAGGANFRGVGVRLLVEKADERPYIIEKHSRRPLCPF